MEQIWEDPKEELLRRELGIPQGAQKVLVFGETSHWDPNWLYTTEEYYESRIKHILDAVITELLKDHRRIFSLESIYFLKLYWDRCPEMRDIFRQLLSEGRMRLTGSGITTPDTVLPATESIIRDYLEGQQWLREKEIEVEPRLAYLPDDFGYSPALPSLFRAMGFDKVGITRIDGMYFIACDLRIKASYPRPGSSAEVLQEQYKTLDFVWRATDGSEVLCHWNAFNYFQGDMLASKGIVRWMGKTYGWSARSSRHIARRIRGYVKALQPLSRTPYMFCPIGCDFNDPIPDLLVLLDRFNEDYYAKTGVWAVNAGLDDYLNLVQCHRDDLPVLEMDPNPYWMGFYASRQEAKLRCNRIVRKLVLAEKLSALPGDPALSPEEQSERIGVEFHDDMKQAWEAAVLSNHHDFVTGTSPDRVWLEEQQPLLEHAEALVDRALERVHVPTEPSSHTSSPPLWTLVDGRLTVTTPQYTMVLDEQRGGAIVSFQAGPGKVELLKEPANDLVSYRDSGGLWRMGHEFLGGSFKEKGRSGAAKNVRIGVAEEVDYLEIHVTCEFAGKLYVRWIWCRFDSPVIRMRLVGSAAKRRTITCRFPTMFSSEELVMNVPGGIAHRPQYKLYTPTFWPARSFAHLKDKESDWGLAVFLGGPAAVSLRHGGLMEWVAFRNVRKEKAFGFLPILAHPAAGTDPQQGSFDYAIWFTDKGDYRENHLPMEVRHALRAAMFPPDSPDLDSLANSVVTTDNPGVVVSAVKPADRGEGRIVRLRSFGSKGELTRLRWTHAPIRKAVLVDARERDLASLAIENGEALVHAPGAITSVRILI
jgi:hypothetical protein